MANTYTSNWQHVTDGETTTHNPQALASTSDDIRILDAEIQWEGVSTSTRKSPTNSSSFNGFVAGTWTGPSYPTIGPNDIFVSQKLDVYVDLTTEGGSSQGAGMLHDPHGSISMSTDYEYSNTKTYGTYERGSVSLQFGGNSAGDAANVSVTTTYDEVTRTSNPRVTRDVNGESNGVTLTDGATSNWYSLTGLDPDSEDFHHDIGGSDKARFRFRFDWEYALPSAVSVAHVPINGSVKEVSLAETDDPALEYNVYRVNTPNNGILAYDLVSPSDSDALPYYIYHPTHGKLAFREKTN